MVGVLLPDGGLSFLRGGCGMQGGISGLPRPRACLQAARVEIPLATKHLFLQLVAEAAVAGF